MPLSTSQLLAKDGLGRFSRGVSRRRARRFFQTSIHPSGVQQAVIGRQRNVRELFPHAGGGQLPVQGLLTAMLSPAPRAVLVGGEERGTWLVDAKAVSDRTFAYALALTRDPGLHPLDG